MDELVWGDCVHRWTGSSSPFNPEMLPDLSLLFSPVFVPDDLFRTPGLFRENISLERKREPGRFRHADELIWFFQQLPVRRIRDRGPVQFSRELKWSEARRIALSRDCYCCQRCGSRERDLLTVHHIFPRGLGGGNELGNLVSLCEVCHQTLCRHCSRPAHLRVSPGESATIAQASREAAGEEVVFRIPGYPCRV